MKSIFGPNWILTAPDEINQKVTVKGRVYRFDFCEMCGPLWLRKDGNVSKYQNPPKAVWNAFARWLRRRGVKANGRAKQ